MGETIKLYCNNCGAKIEISDDREFCYCTYCGTKMLIPGDRKYIHITNDIRKVEEKIDRTKIETSKNLTDIIGVICGAIAVIALLAFVAYMHTH